MLKMKVGITDLDLGLLIHAVPADNAWSHRGWSSDVKHSRTPIATSPTLHPAQMVAAKTAVSVSGVVSSSETDQKIRKRRPGTNRLNLMLNVDKAEAPVSHHAAAFGRPIMLLRFRMRSERCADRLFLPLTTPRTWGKFMHNNAVASQTQKFSSEDHALAPSGA
jgi:hypothetical protein